MKIIDVPQVGKLGLTVTWPGRYGLTRRQWVSPANPNTAAQSQVRSRIVILAAAWVALTEAKQDAWNAAAAAYQTKATLGQSGPLTGYQLFARQNALLAEFGHEQVDAPFVRPTFAAPAITGLTITNAAGVIALKLTAPVEPGEATGVRASAPQNSGVRACKNLRFVGSCPAPVAGASDITALYTARYGVPPVGKRIFVRVAQMVDGWLGPEVAYSALVPVAA